MEYSVYIKQTNLVFFFWKEHFQELTTPPRKCEHRVLVKISDNAEVEMYKSFITEIIETKLHTSSTAKAKSDSNPKEKKTNKGKLETKKAKEEK